MGTKAVAVRKTGVVPSVPHAKLYLGWPESAERSSTLPWWVSRAAQNMLGPAGLPTGGRAHHEWQGISWEAGIPRGGRYSHGQPGKQRQPKQGLSDHQAGGTSRLECFTSHA